MAVAVIGTGGSISSVGLSEQDLYQYGDQGCVLDVEQLLDLVPVAREIAELRTCTLTSQLSSSLGVLEWLNIARTVSSELRMGEVDGAVVTHGTASLEETAFFLDLVLPSTGKPVVIVGAQRPVTGLSSDGPLNLMNAIRVAAHPESRDLGVVVLSNDEIHGALDVIKVSNHRVAAFESPNLGLLGVADPDTVRIYRRPKSHQTIGNLDELADLPRVDIWYSYVGSDGTAIRSFVAQGAAGLVGAGFLPGRMTADERTSVLEAIERGVAVVLSTRSGRGRVMERDSMIRQSIVSAGLLTPPKARILSMVGLTIGGSEGLRQLFADFDQFV